jgi:hypothetical protein
MSNIKTTILILITFMFVMFINHMVFSILYKSFNPMLWDFSGLEGIPSVAYWFINIASIIATAILIFVNGERIKHYRE